MFLADLKFENDNSALEETFHPPDGFFGLDNKLYTLEEVGYAYLDKRTKKTI